MHRREAAATTERTRANACYAITDGNAGEAGATIERIRANAGYAIGNNKVGNFFPIQI